jgi:hypothetical protein
MTFSAAGWKEAGRHFCPSAQDMKKANGRGVHAGRDARIRWLVRLDHGPRGTLAPAEPAKISGYPGKGDKFDEAIADFAAAYADQSQRDHEVLVKAVRAGRLEVFIEEE